MHGREYGRKDNESNLSEGTTSNKQNLRTAGSEPLSRFFLT